MEKKVFYLITSNSQKRNSPARMRLIHLILLIVILTSPIFLVWIVKAQSQVIITINSSNIIAKNKLSIGFNLAGEWSMYCNVPEMNQLAKYANFKLIRIFSHYVEPCSRWYESTKTGNFDWTNVDYLIDTIYEQGAQPLIVLGRA